MRVVSALHLAESVMHSTRSNANSMIKVFPFSMAFVERFSGLRRGLDL